MSNRSMGTIRWPLIRTRVPATLGPMIDEIEQACARNATDPAREIERAFRQRLAQLRAEFETLKAKEKVP